MPLALLALEASGFRGIVAVHSSLGMNLGSAPSYTDVTFFGWRGRVAR
jgi:hypothetical protein